MLSAFLRDSFKKTHGSSYERAMFFES